MFPSEPLLHQQVVARMRARAFRKVEVGAVIYVTRAEMIERGRPTNQGIVDLYNDVKRQFVYADPTETRASATEARKQANTEVMKTGTGSMAAKLNEIANRLDKEADINEARAKGKSPDLVKKQIDFSTSFFKFKNDWDDFYYTLVHDDTTTLYDFLGNELPNKIDNFDSQYRTYVVGYQENGGTLTKPPPPKSDAGDTHLPDLGVTKALNSFPWEKALLFAGGLAAVYWIVTRRSAAPSEPTMPGRLLGPPVPTSEEAALRIAHGG